MVGLTALHIKMGLMPRRWQFEVTGEVGKLGDHISLKGFGMGDNAVEPHDLVMLRK